MSCFSEMYWPDLHLGPVKPGRHLQRLRTHRPPLRQRQRCVDEISPRCAVTTFDESSLSGLLYRRPAVGVQRHLGPVKPSIQRHREGRTHSAFGIQPPGQIAVNQHHQRLSSYDTTSCIAVRNYYYYCYFNPRQKRQERGNDFLTSRAAWQTLRSNMQKQTRSSRLDGRHYSKFSHISITVS